MQNMRKRAGGGLKSHASLLEGRVEIRVYKKKTLIHREVLKNILLYQGNAEIIRGLTSSSPLTPRIITRMAIGDQGTIPSDQTIPKVPVKTMTGLYHEVARQDVDSATQTLYSPTGFTYTGNTVINNDALTGLSSTAGVTIGMVVTGTGIPLGSVVVQILTPTSVQISNNAVSSNTGINITFAGTVNECEFSATFDAVDIPITSFSNPSNPIVNEVGLIIIDPAAVGGIVRPPVYAPNAVDPDEVVLSIRTFNSVPFLAANDISISVRYTLFTE